MCQVQAGCGQVAARRAQCSTPPFANFLAVASPQQCCSHHSSQRPLPVAATAAPTTPPQLPAPAVAACSSASNSSEPPLLRLCVCKLPTEGGRRMPPALATRRMPPPFMWPVDPRGRDHDESQHASAGSTPAAAPGSTVARQVPQEHMHPSMPAASTPPHSLSTRPSTCRRNPPHGGGLARRAARNRHPLLVGQCEVGGIGALLRCRGGGKRSEAVSGAAAACIPASAPCSRYTCQPNQARLPARPPTLRVGSSHVHASCPAVTRLLSLPGGRTMTRGPLAPSRREEHASKHTASPRGCRTGTGLCSSSCCPPRTIARVHNLNVHQAGAHAQHLQIVPRHCGQAGASKAGNVRPAPAPKSRRCCFSCSNCPCSARPQPSHMRPIKRPQPSPVNR